MFVQFSCTFILTFKDTVYILEEKGGELNVIRNALETGTRKRRAYSA